MNKDGASIDSIIKETIKSSFEILKELNKTGISKKTKLIIPSYQNNQSEDGEEATRVSEQELRFVFIEQLLKCLPDGFFYSIETPTDRSYRFSEKGIGNVSPVREEGQSGNFDLTILNKERQLVAIIEFKAKSSSPHAYAKDFCKLWNPNEGQGKNTCRYFINVFESMTRRTRNSFVDKITSSNNEHSFKKQPGDIDVWVVCKSLTEGQTCFEFEGWDTDLKKLA